MRQATISAITQSQLCHNLTSVQQKNLEAYSKSQIDNVFLRDAWRYGLQKKSQMLPQIADYAFFM